MSMDPVTARRFAEDEYRIAMREAVAAVEQLTADGRDDRAAGLAVGVDLGTSAAFMFVVDTRSFIQAAEIIREAIRHANREGD